MCKCIRVYVRILNALQERREEREKMKKYMFQQREELVEKKEWETFWNEESPRLFHYACVHGTVEIVKYFVAKLVSPTIR